MNGVLMVFFVSANLFAQSAGQTMPGKDLKETTTLNFSMKTLDGEDVSLSDKYAGKVLLIVNTASKCGMTPQYEQLQALHEKYSDQGLAILGFPCNQFGGQEPGTADEIQQFCQKKYGVEFDLFSKIDVNGNTQCELYKYLTSLELEPVGEGKISWNFEKFLIDRNGKPVARFGPRTKPDSQQVVEQIEKLLEKK